MSSPGSPYRIFSLGDNAITIDFGNRIDEKLNGEVLARYQEWRNDPIPGMTEIVPAYSSLTIYYDLQNQDRAIGGSTTFEKMKLLVESRLQQPVQLSTVTSQLTRIPVCYDAVYAPDLNRLAIAKELTPAAVIALHTAATYKVYMLGFLPGFAYMGGTDERIAMPRKPQPVNVAAGSVGIAGIQTGIYPINSPGGWHIIGRTPLQLFDPRKNDPVLLKTGDRVEFYAISKEEFSLLQNTAPREKEEGNT